MGNGANGGQQIRCGCSLDDIACRASTQRAKEVFLGLVHRQKQHANVRRLLANTLARFHRHPIQA